jgi:hypothetical protein
MSTADMRIAGPRLRSLFTAIAASVAAACTGCSIFIPPLYKTDVEDAGGGFLEITRRAGGEGGVSAETERFPLHTVVYHPTPAGGGATAVEFALYSYVEDESRPGQDALHYLNFEAVVDPDTLEVSSVNPHTLVLMARPTRASVAVYRYARSPGTAALAGRIGEDIRGRFRFELDYIVGLPAGERTPITVDLEFTAKPELDFLRRLKRGRGNEIRRLEQKLLDRTSRPPSEDLDLIPLPEPERPAPAAAP